MEQRIQSLEEEVKLLKNQIRAVLLDIKENLASGDWQAHPGNNKAAELNEDSDQQPEVENLVDSAFNSKPAIETKSIPGSRIGESGCDGSNIRPGQESHHTQTEPPNNKVTERETATIGHNDYHNAEIGEVNGKSSKNSFEPLTLMLLLQWLERTQSSLGKEQTQALVELYCTSRDLPEQARQTLQLVMALYSRDGGHNADTTTIPYLLELDQLINNQEETGKQRDLVLKFLASNQTSASRNK